MGTFGKGFILGGISALVGVFAAATISVIRKDRCFLKDSSSEGDATVETASMGDYSGEEDSED